MKKLLLLILLTLSGLINIYAQWTQSSGFYPYSNVQALTTNGTVLFASTGSDAVYKSTDSGVNWTQTTYFSYGNIPTLGTIGTIVYAGSNGNGVYKTFNNGTNWTQTSLNDKAVISMLISGDTIYAGVLDSGIFISRNVGMGWTHMTLNTKSIRSLAKSGNYLYAGTFDTTGLYISSNGGNTWSLSSLNRKAVYSLAVNGNYIYAGTKDSGIYISSNYGVTWTQNPLNNTSVYCITYYYSIIFIGTNSRGVLMSSNNGASWVQKNEGFPILTIVHDLMIAHNYIFAGTSNNTVWRRPYAEIIGIKNISNELPERFSLSQNYPNPFNPNTIIKFKVKDSRLVSLKIFDNSGKEIENLVNIKINPGEYEVRWNATNYPSGVYFYKLRAGIFSETKKMVLLK